MANGKSKPAAAARRAIDWEKIQAEYSIGGPDNSIRSIATRHGITHQAVSKRKRLEDWPDPEDLDDVIRRKVATTVAGVVAGGNQQKRAEAISEAADRRAAVVLRHQTEWDELEELRREALEARDADAVVGPDGKVVTGTEVAFEKAKLLKIMTEATSIKQSAQRKAWALDAKEPPKNPGGLDIGKLLDAIQGADTGVSDDGGC